MRYRNVAAGTLGLALLAGCGSEPYGGHYYCGATEGTNVEPTYDISAPDYSRSKDPSVLEEVQAEAADPGDDTELDQLVCWVDGGDTEDRQVLTVAAIKLGRTVLEQ